MTSIGSVSHIPNKKIAFLFLIYDQIDHEDLWYEFFSKDDKDRHSIYVHYKYDKKLRYLENCKLSKCYDTAWGHISLVAAQNLLLREAMKDSTNDRFVFCSGTCVPLKSFEYVYKSIDPKFSYFNMRPDEECFPRCNNAVKYINREHIKKASQWCILNRNHVELMLATDKYMEWFNDTIGDEHCYISYLHRMELQNELILQYNDAEYATTFTNWSNVPGYKYQFASSTTNLKNYTRITTEELLHLVRSPCLFGRKFLSECDLSVLKQMLIQMDTLDKIDNSAVPWGQTTFTNYSDNRLVNDPSTMKHDKILTKHISSYRPVSKLIPKMYCERR